MNRTAGFNKTGAAAGAAGVQSDSATWQMVHVGVAWPSACEWVLLTPTPNRNNTTRKTTLRERTVSRARDPVDDKLALSLR